jgi:hypothetical protein
MVLFRFVGVFLFRFAERRFCGLLFQAPPRITRFAQEADQVSTAGPCGPGRESHAATLEYGHDRHARPRSPYEYAPATQRARLYAAPQ